MKIYKTPIYHGNIPEIEYSKRFGIPVKQIHENKLLNAIKHAKSKKQYFERLQNENINKINQIVKSL